jgi:hypothetical protein
MCVDNGGTQSNSLLAGVCRSGAWKTALNGIGCSNPVWPCDQGVCQNNICVIACVPKTCSSQGFACGSQSDGCGNTQSCGACDSGKVCSNGACVADCTSHASQKCNSGNLYWYNSCGNKEELAQNCGVDTVTSNYQCSANWLQKDTIKKGCDNGACYSTDIWINDINCSAAGKVCSGGVCAAANSGNETNSTITITTTTNTNTDSSNNATNSSTSNSNVTNPVTQMTRAEILSKIAQIQDLIVSLQKQLAAMTGNATTTFSCTQITKNLYYGMANDSQVKCLQEILKSQGYAIAVSGNYDAATKTAVAQFQQKYASEILAPYHLTRGSGNVGNATLEKLNKIFLNK